MRTFFVRYGNFFAHVSTTPKQQQSFLGPLSIARGQKLETILQHCQTKSLI